MWVKCIPRVTRLGGERCSVFVPLCVSERPSDADLPLTTLPLNRDGSPPILRTDILGVFSILPPLERTQPKTLSLSAYSIERLEDIVGQK